MEPAFEIRRLPAVGCLERACCLGLGAAIGKKGSLSRFAVFIFPLAIIVSFGAMLGLALGHPLLC
jgi:hypothetical protein